MRPDQINPLMTPIQDFLGIVASDQDVRDLSDAFMELERRVSAIERGGEAAAQLPGLLISPDGDRIAEDLMILRQWCDKANWNLGGDEDALRRQSMVLDHIHTLVTRLIAGGHLEPPAAREVIR